MAQHPHPQQLQPHPQQHQQQQLPTIYAPQPQHNPQSGMGPVIPRPQQLQPATAGGSPYPATSSSTPIATNIPPNVFQSSPITSSAAPINYAPNPNLVYSPNLPAMIPPQNAYPHQSQGGAPQQQSYVVGHPQQQHAQSAPMLYQPNQNPRPGPVHAHSYSGGFTPTNTNAAPPPGMVVAAAPQFVYPQQSSLQPQQQQMKVPAVGGRVRLRFAFRAENPGELDINPGEMLHVMKIDGVWLQGRTDSNRQGWVPLNYTDPV
jgi:hypothetical protein